MEKKKKKKIQGGFILLQWQQRINISKIALWFVSRFVLPEEYSIVSTFQNRRGRFLDGIGPLGKKRTEMQLTSSWYVSMGRARQLVSTTQLEEGLAARVPSLRTRGRFLMETGTNLPRVLGKASSLCLHTASWQAQPRSVTTEQGGQMEMVPWQGETRTTLLPGGSSGPYCIHRAPLDLGCQELPYAQLRLCIVIAGVHYFINVYL